MALLQNQSDQLESWPICSPPYPFSSNEGRLNARIAKLDETLKARRMVERATRILAEHQNIDEDDAYALIRTEAMNKQVTVSEMANSIINADKIFKK